MIVRAFGVLIAMVIVDIAWARYIQTVADKQALRAASWAAFLYILGAFVVTQYTHDVRMLIPAAIGSFIGTYYGARKGS